MRLTSTGLGIGTSSPSFKLDVAVTDTTAYSTSAYSYEPVRITNSGAGGVSGILFQALSTGTANTAQATISVIAESASSKNTAITFGTRENAGGTVPERMRIDSSGNLGLGVTPSAWDGVFKAFDVGQAGNGISGNSGTTELTQAAYYNSGWKYSVSSTASAKYELNVGTHRWFIAPSGTAGNAISFTQAMSLDANGRLIIGNTSTIGPAKINTYFGGATEDGIDLKNTNTGNTGSFVGFFNSSGGVAGSISQSSATTVLYNVSSDYRLKNITGPITNSGAYIDSLNPVEGTWKADGSTFIGLIAHEVQESSRTQVATGTKDGEEMQAMDYSSPEIIANLIAEIQSLRKRLADAGIA